MRPIRTSLTMWLVLLFACALLLTLCERMISEINELKPIVFEPVQPFKDRMHGAGKPPTEEEAAAVGKALLISGATPEKLEEALGQPSEHTDGTFLNLYRYSYRPGRFLEFVFSPEGIVLAKGPFQPLGILSREGALDRHNSSAKELRRLASYFEKWGPGSFRVFQSWSLAYDMVACLEDNDSRWGCVEAAIALLRDGGPREHPESAGIMEQIGLLFLDKVGGELDPHHAYYQHRWALKMQEIVGDYDAQNVGGWSRSHDASCTLYEKLKIGWFDVILEMEKRCGTFDWRLPYPHAIYWLTLAAGNQNSPIVRSGYDRLVLKSLEETMRRGRIAWLPPDPNQPMIVAFDLGKIPAIEALYRKQMNEEPHTEALRDGHIKFLQEAEFDLYFAGYVAEAEKYHKELRDLYNKPDPYVPLEEECLGRLHKCVDDSPTPASMRAEANGQIALACLYGCTGCADNARFWEKIATADWEVYGVYLEAQWRSNTRTKGPAPARSTFQQVTQETVRNILAGRVAVFPKELLPVLRQKLKIPAGADPEEFELTGPLVPPIPPDSPLLK